MARRLRNFIFGGGNGNTGAITIYRNAAILGTDGLHDILEIHSDTGCLAIECVDPSKDYSRIKVRAAETHQRRARERGSYRLDNSSRQASEAQTIREAKALAAWRMPA